MSNVCEHCRHPNPERAKFCGRCGQGLAAQFLESLNPLPGPKPRAQSKRCCGGSGGLAFLICLGALGVCWIGKPGPHRSISGADQSHQDLSLAPSKAEALFNLLSPDDVAVKVGPHHGGRFIGGQDFSVSGTPEEVQIVRQFARLITRLEDESWFHDGESTDNIFAETCERTYRLSRSKAKSLAKILSSSDVPVIATRRGSRLVVSATVEDHRIIAGIVHLLGGRQAD